MEIQASNWSHCQVVNTLDFLLDRVQRDSESTYRTLGG